jgi:hypothetical protein
MAKSEQRTRLLRRFSAHLEDGQAVEVEEHVTEKRFLLMDGAWTDWQRLMRSLSIGNLHVNVEQDGTMFTAEFTPRRVIPD